MLALTDYGSLAYTFSQVLDFIKPYMLGRTIGGGLYVLGMLVMVYNLYMTSRSRIELAEQKA